MPRVIETLLTDWIEHFLTYGVGLKWKKRLPLLIAMLALVVLLAGTVLSRAVQ